jgi:hypothetical protein
MPQSGMLRTFGISFQSAAMWISSGHALTFDRSQPQFQTVIKGMKLWGCIQDSLSNAQPSPSTFIGSARWRSGMLWPAQQSEVKQKPCPGVDETT